MKFQTPAEEIYTLAKNQAGMGKLVSNSIGVNLHIMANFEETSIGLFQTPAEEIYTLNSSILSHLSSVSNSSGGNLHDTDGASKKAAKMFQTPAEEIYTLKIAKPFEIEKSFKLQRRKFTQSLRR